MSGAPATLRQIPVAARAALEGLRRRIGWQAERASIGEARLFLSLSVIIGLFSGLFVVLFRIAIDWTHIRVFGSALTPPWLRILLVPTLGGLVVAFLVVRFFPRARGSGVNQTKAAVYIYDGFVPFRTVIGKFVTCALAIGSGQSLGPEDPSLQMGAGIASALGRRMRFSRDKVRLIAPVGAAAGLAAAFNAPISAVLFVIEEVIGKWTAGVLGAIVLSAVSSVVVARWFLGDQALFPHTRLPPGSSCGVAGLRRAGSDRGGLLAGLRETRSVFAPAAQGSPALDALFSAGPGRPRRSE